MILIHLYGDHILLPPDHLFSVYSCSSLNGSARITTDEQSWNRIKQRDIILPRTAEQLKDSELKIDPVDTITNTCDVVGAKKIDPVDTITNTSDVVGAWDLIRSECCSSVAREKLFKKLKVSTVLC